MNNPVKTVVMNLVVNFRLKMFHKYERSYDFFEEINKVKKILVILPSSDKFKDHMQEFINAISQTFKNASVSTFASSTLRNTDLSWFGVPNEKYLNIIREEGFDLVIDTNMGQNKLCSYLCALSGAQLRLNLSSSNYDHIYNLHFRSDQTKPVPERLKNIITNFEQLNIKN